MFVSFAWVLVFACWEKKREERKCWILWCGAFWLPRKVRDSHQLKGGCSRFPTFFSATSHRRLCWWWCLICRWRFWCDLNWYQLTKSNQIKKCLFASSSWDGLWIISELSLLSLSIFFFLYVCLVSEKIQGKKWNYWETENVPVLERVSHYVTILRNAKWSFVSLWICCPDLQLTFSCFE